MDGMHQCAGSIENPTIEAAILAINHSFIVDNYNCGEQLGIADCRRGDRAEVPRRGRHLRRNGGTGYSKNYNYDDRLRYVEPPDFMEPVQSAWIIGRETIELTASFS